MVMLSGVWAKSDMAAGFQAVKERIPGILPAAGRSARASAPSQIFFELRRRRDGHKESSSDKLTLSSMCTPCMPTLPVSEPPQIQVYAAQPAGRPATAKKLMLDWYPRINTLLYGPGHPLPHAQLAIRVKAKLKYAGVPAYAEGGTIYLWADYIARQDEADFEGMVIHELTHINQAAQNVGENGWVAEGVADYVRHKYFARDIETTLRLAPDGRLQGYLPQSGYLYDLQQEKADLGHQGYQRSYTVASTFLYWLESRKDSHIVQEISTAFEQGNFTPALFALNCGKPLDALWDEFVIESKLR